MWLAMKKWGVGGAGLVASAVALAACGIGTTTVLQGQSSQKTDPLTSHRVPSRPAGTERPASTVRPQGAARTKTSAGTIRRSTALAPTIHLWHMSLRVPKGWKLVARETSAGATVWTIRGASGQAQLTSTPLSPRRDPEQLLPWPNGRYVLRTSSGPREVLVQLTTQKGTEDTLAVHLRSGLGGASLIPAIVGTWTHPPLMTVNRAVTQLEQLHRRGDYPYSLSYGTADEGWLLAPGGATGPQAMWDLFQTTDHGRTWRLERQTQLQGHCVSSMPACEFPMSGGDATLRFWNAEDGVIAQTDFAYNAASVYRTTDGGKTWFLTSISLPSEAGTVALRRAQGMLVLTIAFSSRSIPPEVWYSGDGGVAWTRR